MPFVPQASVGSITIPQQHLRIGLNNACKYEITKVMTEREGFESSIHGFNDPVT